ncbi:MAG: SHOCT domain-containing protein [Anaerosomatales bacterium]|nr:SHOCT domain-containing protein [Anaerosomatales bacterium]MDT8434408.1 SHOCT domain-containing protein [Anaerosomatales bacterium]
MTFGPVLILAFGMLAIYAIHNTRVLARADVLPVPASTPADGALRISRRRLATGEIDTAEFERIRTVLCG